MKEQIISFETAKLAKSKKFPQYVIGNSGGRNDKYHIEQDNDKDYFYLKQTFYSPPQSLLQKWLRDVHQVIVIVSFYNNGEDWEETEYMVTVSEFKHFTTHDSFVKSDFKSYEDALEDGLITGLKLIQNADK